MSLVAVAVSAGSTGAGLVGAVVTTGCAGAGLVGAALTTGSAGAAGDTETVSCAIGSVSVCPGWIGALASGVAPPPVSLSSRACSFA